MTVLRVNGAEAKKPKSVRRNNGESRHVPKDTSGQSEVKGRRRVSEQRHSTQI